VLQSDEEVKISEDEIKEKMVTLDTKKQKALNNRFGPRHP
jgi:hypothetical protein